MNVWYNVNVMTDFESEKSPGRRIDLAEIPGYSNDWDRFLSVYNIQELPSIPPDGEPGSETMPLSLKVLREFFITAANDFAMEIWFDFAPEEKASDDSERSQASEGAVDVCYAPHGRGTTAIRIPDTLFFREYPELGIFRWLLANSDEAGMFAIYSSEFKDKPRHDPFDKRGRLVPPPDFTPSGNSTDREDEPDVPGVTEVAIIRAFRISLKGHEIPNDLVIQICPRFWHMPTGFSVG